MILSFRPLGKNERREINATIRINYPFATTIVLGDGQVLDLSIWQSCDYRIVRVDRQEMKALIRMGLTV